MIKVSHIRKYVVGIAQSTMCMCAHDVFGECRRHSMCVEIKGDLCEMSYKASGYGTLVPGLVQASAFTC